MNQQEAQDAIDQKFEVIYCGLSPIPMGGTMGYFFNWHLASRHSVDFIDHSGHVYTNYPITDFTFTLPLNRFPGPPSLPPSPPGPPSTINPGPVGLTEQQVDDAIANKWDIEWHRQASGILTGKTSGILTGKIVGWQNTPTTVRFAEPSFPTTIVNINQLAWCQTKPGNPYPPGFSIHHTNASPLYVSSSDVSSSVYNNKRFPHKCTRCLAPSFNMLQLVECSNMACEMFVPGARGAE